MITLKVHQELGVDGFQDDDGVEHYDPNVYTKYGVLGSLKISREDDTVTIVDAPGVILISDKLLAEGGDDVAQVYESPLGNFRTVAFHASNGWVRYQVEEDNLEWSDRPEDPVPHRLAFLTVKDLAE